jgi:hypothetical protein
MTASVQIVVERRDDVLLVPNRAIRTQGRQRIVQVLFEGQVIEVPVTVGLSNESQSEVTGQGLREGDEVVINAATATGTQAGPGRVFGGLGGGGFTGGGVIVRP